MRGRLDKQIRALAAVALFAAGAGAAASGSTAATGTEDSVSPHLWVVSESLGITYGEAKWREAWTAALVPLATAVNEDRDHFAEVHKTDAGGNWRAVVNYVGHLGTAQALVNHLIPDGAPVEWRPVSRSGASLDGLRAEIESRMTASGSIRSVGVDVLTNTIIVAVLSPEIGHDLVGQYGPAVSLERLNAEPESIVPHAQPDATPPPPASHGTGCFGRFGCPRWRGGIATDLGSTYTFWAKRYSGGSWHYYVLTSGHGPDNHTYKHNGVTVGNIDRGSFWEAAIWSDLHEGWVTSSDVARVSLASTAHNSLRNNWVYDAAANMEHALTALRNSSQTSVGDVICKSGMGYSPLTSCGTVISKSHSVWTTRDPDYFPAAVLVQGLNRADFNGSYSGYGLAPGDSGATVYSGGTHFMGIAGPNQLGYYSVPSNI